MIKKAWFLAAVALVALAGSGFIQSPAVLTLSGKVMMEDGSPPQPEVQVELVCNSRVIRVAKTRAEGSFHFRLGEERRPTELSASSSGPDTLETGKRGIGGLGAGGRLRESGDGRYDLTNCEIRVTPRPDWKANKIRLGVQSVFEPDVGVITIRKVTPPAGTLVSASTLSAPEAASKAYQQARKAMGKKKPDYKRAARKAERAVEIYPEFAEAWKLLGDARLQAGDREAAREAYREAISADSKYIPPHMTLAEMELEKFRYGEALKYTSRLVELAPNDSKGRYYHGLASYSSGGLEAAMESFAVVEKNGDSEEYPASCLMMGDILARKGDLSSSAKYLRWFLEIGRHSPEMGEQVRRQLKSWEEKGLIEKKP